MDDERKAALAQRRREDEVKHKKVLTKKYSQRGIQKMSLSEYDALRRKKALRQQERKLPRPIKLLLSVPVFIIFAAGLLFLPYLLYLVATSPSSDSKKTKEDVHQSIEKNGVRTISSGRR